ncbi:hypothetical protein IIO_06646 [Bacillus cereus VD115]|nr:hypothetical protein IIO_06646 [Bacillus cereus VD115]
MQSKLIIVDDSIYEELSLKENNFGILRFNIKNILMNNVPNIEDIKFVEKSYPEVEIISIKTNRGIHQ